MIDASGPVALYALVAVALVALGVHALLVRAHLLHKVLALNVMGAGTFLLLVAIARRNAADPPDPVPHAMVLTGIVVAVSLTAFAIAIIRRLAAATGSAELPDPSPPGADGEE